MFLLATAAIVLCGCGTYIPPSGRADLSAVANPSMQESFSAKPAAAFPAYIAAVRVQAPGYHNYYTDESGGVYGSGRYSVITIKEVEDDADFERLQRLPNLGGLITINPLLLPRHLTSDAQIRDAAARLKADMVLLYTFDTSFHNNDESVALNVISLGLSPTRHVYVHVDASALLVDTRTGFIYAAFEANEHQKILSNAWESGETADRARRDSERAAFKDLVDQFQKNWPRIIDRAKQGS